MKIFDLSHTLENGMPVYPGLKEPSFEEEYTLEEDGFKETSLHFLSHTGTHIDCPAHMLKSDLSTNTMDLSSFYGSAFVADFSYKKEGEKIEIDEIKKFEARLKSHQIVLIYTSWDKFWGKDKYFRAFPVLSFEAVDYIVACGVKAIGLDVISIDAMNAKVYQNHLTALEKNVVIIENLTNLQFLLNQKFIFSALPLKIKNGDGSPVRAVGIVNK